MVIAANKANGETPDPRIVAQGKPSSTTSSKTDTKQPPPPPPDATPIAHTAAEEAAPAPAPPPPPPPPRVPRTYTVVSGDTLWAIAERFYGDGNKYHEIAAASGIANRDLIPGQVLTIP
jgi:nucleoid-associated protein YgaU